MQGNGDCGGTNAQKREAAAEVISGGRHTVAACTGEKKPLARATLVQRISVEGNFAGGRFRGARKEAPRRGCRGGDLPQWWSVEWKGYARDSRAMVLRQRGLQRRGTSATREEENSSEEGGLVSRWHRGGMSGEEFGCRHGCESAQRL
ncbi:unnamed protein product [Victoria cruziana]